MEASRKATRCMFGSIMTNRHKAPKCVALLLLSSLLNCAPARAACSNDSRVLIPEIRLAIEDEIYDTGRFNEYFQIDGNPGGINSNATISFAVGKSISKNCVGVVVYKHMPQGEVYRYFSVDDKKIILSGHSDSKFRPTGGSMLTVYMPMADLAKFVEEASYLSYCSVNPHPDKQLLDASSRRQISRIGFSFRMSG